MSRLHRTLDETVVYPEHEPRETSSTFAHARHHLVDILGVGCWIGGATKTDLDAGLPDAHRCAGATQLEAHHSVIEWAAFNGIDWHKVAADFPKVGIHSDDDFRRFAESEGGLLILCDKHHRGREHGVHMLSYPVWVLDRYAQDSFEFTPDEAA